VEICSDVIISIQRTLVKEIGYWGRGLCALRGFPYSLPNL